MAQWDLHLELPESVSFGSNLRETGRTLLIKLKITQSAGSGYSSAASQREPGFLALAAEKV